MLAAATTWIGFRPFEAVPRTGTGGDLANQIGFLLLGLVGIWLLASAKPKVRRALGSPLYLLVVAILFWSASISDGAGSALRAALFSLFVMIVAAGVVATPRTRAEFTGTLGWAAFVALSFSYVAVFLFPESGTHDGSGFEPQHAGLWRGVYSHKNVASYVAGMFALIGAYIATRGRPALGGVVLVLATAMVILAGSKTVLIVLPVAFATAWVAARTSPAARAVAVVLPVSVMVAATLGLALTQVGQDLRLAVAPDLTFTGRIDLWVFTAERIAENWWTGTGFESYWGTPQVTQMEQPIELSWDVRGIVHAHNSYLDAVLAFGMPAGTVIVFALIVVPVRDFARIPRGPALDAAQLWISLWLLAALGACLESFFLRRADPVWFAMAMSVVGLRLCSRLGREVQ